jgi:hypothetical protein
MSFFSEASLAMIPSGYKTSKVYSAIPTSGDGDLTFLRSNDTATRVGPDGLIEKVRTNLILQSQTFDNASWVKSASGTGVNPVVTANNATAPDGTMTADTIVFDAGAGTSNSDISNIYQTLTLGGTIYAGSFYARVTSGTGQLVFRHALGGAYTKANLTTTWQRFSSAETFGGGTQYFEIGIRRDVSEPVNASVTVQMWGAQLETGDIATDYIATTSAAVSVGPVANVPRLDYLDSSSPRLLLEPQRTNSVLFSEQFDNAAWTKLNATISANATTSPDGYSNADQIIDDTTNGTHLAYQILGSRSVGTAWSVFMKKGTLNYGFIGNVQSSTDFTTAVIDLTDGTVKEIQNGSGNTGSVTVQNYGNGWYRVIMQSSANGGGTSVGCSDGSALSGATKDAIYTGTGSGSIYTFGAQLEDASYATSYIPTLGAAVTRSVDYTLKSGSSLAENAKTWFCDVNITEGRVNGSSEMFLTIRGGAYEGYFRYFANNVLHFQYYGATGSAQIVLNSAIPAGTTARVKMAARIENNDMVFYVNGAQIGTNTTATRGTGMNILEVGTYGVNAGYHISNSINELILFPTALTNAQLAELTA